MARRGAWIGISPSCAVLQEGSECHRRWHFQSDGRGQIADRRL